MTHARLLIASMRLALPALLALLVSGCGLKGGLYLPEKTDTPVIITPASSASSSSSSSQVAP